MLTPLPVNFSVRMPRQESEDGNVLGDVAKCVSILKGLEERWSGAARSCAIVERLMAHHVNTGGGFNSNNSFETDVHQSHGDDSGGSSEKRYYNELEHSAMLDFGGDQPYLNQLLGSELFGFESPDDSSFGMWGAM